MEAGSSSGNTSVNECDVISLSSSGNTIAVALCYGILIPAIVLGNGLVVISFIINHKLRTATNIFICGLGLSDLLIGLFSVPYWTYISSLESLMDAYCTRYLYIVYICIDIWTGCASILQLTAIAIERLYFTVTPLRHRQLSRSVYWYMIGIAWFYSTFMAVLQPLQTQWQKEYSVLLMVTCFVFPLFIIVAVYLYILKVGRRQAQKKPSTRKRMGSTGGDFKEFNIFITVTVITGVFVIAWAPFFVVTVVASLCHECISHPEHDPLVRVVKWMQYSSSAINPYIYAYRNEEVRLTFKKILRSICFCGCCRSKTRFDYPRKNVRNVHLHAIGQGAKKDEDDSEDVRPKNRPVGQMFPRVLNIDELTGHTQDSRTNAPRDTMEKELDVVRQNPRWPAGVHDPTMKNVRFYENNGFEGIQCLTRNDKERHEDKNNRNFEEKGVANEAFMQSSRRELHLERQGNKYQRSSHDQRNQRPSNLTRKPKQSTNQNRTHKSHDSRIDSIAHSDRTSDKSTNKKRIRKPHDREMSRGARDNHIKTLGYNETSHELTNHGTRNKEMTGARRVRATYNDEISDDASYV